MVRCEYCDKEICQCVTGIKGGNMSKPIDFNQMKEQLMSAIDLAEKFANLKDQLKSKTEECERLKLSQNITVHCDHSPETVFISMEEAEVMKLREKELEEENERLKNGTLETN